MTISQAEAFEQVKQYLLNNYPDARDITMPYCSLYNDTVHRSTYYKIQLNYRRATGIQRPAIFQIDPDSGAVALFKENYNWTYWSA